MLSLGSVPTGVDTRVPLTEISLLPAEFEEYQIGVDASITFCLKELRVRPTLHSLLSLGPKFAAKQ